MTAKQARIRRDELEREVHNAAVGVENANADKARELAAATEAVAEREQALADAARGREGASERAEHARSRTLKHQASAREAEERATAARQGQADATLELRQHVTTELAVFAADADKLADRADRDVGKAIEALKGALQSRQAALTAWSTLSVATGDHRTAGLRLGDTPPLVLDEVLQILDGVQRPEPALADEARKPGLLSRIFTSYKRVSDGTVLDRVRRSEYPGKTGVPEDSLTSANNTDDWIRVGDV